MACSNIRYGAGVTAEVGMDLANMKAKHVAVYTDKGVAGLPAMKTTLDSLTKSNINFKVYDDVRVEPTDQSFIKASNFAKEHDFDTILAVGGGSVIDTAKAANLYSSDPEAEFLDYVNAPIGKGKPVTVPLKPLIASKFFFCFSFFLVKIKWVFLREINSMRTLKYDFSCMFI